jgi:hypothetical protein
MLPAAIPQLEGSASASAYLQFRNRNFLSSLPLQVRIKEMLLRNCILALLQPIAKV